MEKTEVLKHYENELAIAKESLKMTEGIKSPEWAIANRAKKEEIERLEIVVEALKKA